MPNNDIIKAIERFHGSPNVRRSVKHRSAAITMALLYKLAETLASLGSARGSQDISIIKIYGTLRAPYYEPIAKKVDLAHPRARPHAGAHAESIFNIIFEFSAVFTCYLTYYKPIAKKRWFGAPTARHGRAVRAKRDFLHL